LDARNYYSKGVYPIQIPGGRLIPGPPQGRYWTVSESKFWELDRDKRIWWGEDGKSEPNVKKFLSEVRDGVVPQTLWSWKVAGSTRNSKSELIRILGGTEKDIFVTPKPSKLIDRILKVATDRNSVVLDSFAGSGTTAHSVLKANKRDGGNRRFILVEMEEYADSLTAERVRRVINGYAFQGKQKTELLRERLTWRALCSAEELVRTVQAIENLHGHEHDDINKEVKDSELIVIGEKTIEKRVDGLGGTFTYCTLGAPVELDKVLSGQDLPAFSGLGAALFHMATNRALDPSSISENEFYLGATEGQHVWLIYKPDLDWLKSPEAALTLGKAKAFSATDPDSRHLVFAPARFVSQKMLAEHGLPVEFVPLPFALYRIDRS
jgi:adenine-specific DNA-methyltransferase